MSANLKPCDTRFCGYPNAVYLEEDSGRSSYYVICRGCNTKTKHYEREDEAIEAWNHRPFEEHAVEVLADILCINDYEPGYKNRDVFRAEAKKLLKI